MDKKRITQAAREAAKTFSRSASSGAWMVVDPDLLIDSLVVQYIRALDLYVEPDGAPRMVSTGDLIEFRRRLVEQLASRGYVVRS